MLYFITETYLKVNTPITANVDVTDVTPYVATQAALRVQPILGTTFYNHMLTAYNAQTLTPDEVDLVEFIQPVIAWRSAEDAVFGLTYQLKNKGLQTWLLTNKNLFPIFISATNTDTDLRPMFNHCNCITPYQLTCTGLCGDLRENGYNNSILVI